MGSIVVPLLLKKDGMYRVTQEESKQTSKKEGLDFQKET